MPTPAPDEVLIKTTATTICTSDLNDIAGNVLGMQLPLVMGHEGAGRVAAVGQRGAGVRRGATRGGASGGPLPTMRALPPRPGAPLLADAPLGLQPRRHVRRILLLRADRLRPVPDGLDMAVAALMEPVCVCLESLRRARFSRGETLLVVGDGPFGLLTARLALEYGPSKLILVGRHDFRMGHVPEAVAIHEKRVADAVESVLQETGGLGVDVAIVCASSQSAMDQCVASVRARGRVVVFSTIPGRPTVDLFRVHLKELEILGSCNDEDELDLAMACLANPELRLDQLVTHRLPLDAVAEGLGTGLCARESKP